MGSTCLHLGRLEVSWPMRYILLSHLTIMWPCDWCHVITSAYIVYSSYIVVLARVVHCTSSKCVLLRQYNICSAKSRQANVLKHGVVKARCTFVHSTIGWVCVAVHSRLANMSDDVCTATGFPVMFQVDPSPRSGPCPVLTLLALMYIQTQHMLLLHIVN